MNRLTKVTRMITSLLAEVAGLGGTTQNRMVSVKGIYSKPKGETGLVVRLAKGNNQDVIIPLQKEVDLQDGDVYVTDDKNHIHFRYSDGKIHILGDTIFADNVTIEKDLHVKGRITCDTDIEAKANMKAGANVEAGANAISAMCLAGSYAGAGGGAVVSNSTIQTTKDVIADGISLKEHSHPITGGSSAGTTGSPQ